MTHCVMYKKGESKVVRGIPCDLVRIKYSEIDSYLEAGYSHDVNYLYEEVKKVITKDEFLFIFNDNPTRLTKEEMIAFAKEYLDLKLTKNSKEATLIEKISKALESE